MSTGQFTHSKGQFPFAYIPSSEGTWGVWS